jgi:hypothetical protein
VIEAENKKKPLKSDSFFRSVLFVLSGHLLRSLVVYRSERRRLHLPNRKLLIKFVCSAPRNRERERETCRQTTDVIPTFVPNFLLFLVSCEPPFLHFTPTSTSLFYLLNRRNSHLERMTTTTTTTESLTTSSFFHYDDDDDDDSARSHFTSDTASSIHFNRHSPSLCHCLWCCRLVVLWPLSLTSSQEPNKKSKKTQISCISGLGKRRIKRIRTDEQRRPNLLVFCFSCGSFSWPKNALIVGSIVTFTRRKVRPTSPVLLELQPKTRAHKANTKNAFKNRVSGLSSGSRVNALESD